MSKSLLNDLEGELVLKTNLEETILNSLHFYCNFEKTNTYYKRIQKEIRLLFLEKTQNRTYFYAPPKENSLKPIGYNQIIHILLKRLWDEEDYGALARIPKEINFVESEDIDLERSRVSLEDCFRYISNLRVLPFISPEAPFFLRKESDKVRIAYNWIQSGHKLQEYLNRIKIVGTFVQTLHFSGTYLLEVAKQYEKNPLSVREPKEESQILEERTNQLVSLIMKHPLVAQGYFKFTESALKRTIQGMGSELIQNRAQLKFYYNLFLKSKSPVSKISEEDIVKVAAKVMYDFNKLIEKEDEPVIVPKATLPESSNIDFAHVIDGVLYFIRKLLLSNVNVINLHSYLKKILDNLKHEAPELSEKHLSLVYLLLKDLQQNKYPKEKDVLEHIALLSEKLGINNEDSKTIYLLIKTEEEKEFAETSLKKFVENTIQTDEKILNEKQITLLRTLFGTLPETVTVNEFYSVKEKLKSKVEEPSKKKMIDVLAELIHVKIAETRGKIVVSKIKVMENSA
ncbi:MAG: hypothetical protein SFU98_22650 [Leptospiraceae bacterium]|nr:hypothetical protein [Leptospiraceae bacterium]